MRKRQIKKNNSKRGLLDVQSIKRKLDKYFRNVTTEQLRNDLIRCGYTQQQP